MVKEVNSEAIFFTPLCVLWEHFDKWKHSSFVPVSLYTHYESESEQKWVDIWFWSHKFKIV